MPLLEYYKANGRVVESHYNNGGSRITYGESDVYPQFEEYIKPPYVVIVETYIKVIPAENANPVQVFGKTLGNPSSVECVEYHRFVDNCSKLKSAPYDLSDWI